MVRLFTLLVLVLTSLISRAQFTYTLDTTIHVFDENQTRIRMPWAGGLNSPEFNTLDLNGDGTEDLVVFDRMGQKVITFLAVDDKYIHAPVYEPFFPSNLMNWLLLRDYNGDGKKDIFTGDIFGIRVFTNVTTGDTPEWKHFKFYVSATSRSDALLSQGLSGLINVQLQFDDMPSITDIDGDGDLDIFCMKYGTAGTIELHKNLSVETYGHTDSLKYKLFTQAWGGVRECACGSMSFNGDPCKGADVGRTEHAGGKALLAIDYNTDSKLDLLISEGDCTSLYLIDNDGTIDEPILDGFSRVSGPTDGIFLVHPSPYLEDVDFDGVKDLMIASNVFSKDFLQTDFSRSAWFYKNTGSNAAPNFVLIRQNFLQSDMFDLGDNAVPAFADVDGDGDYDMLVSNNNFPASVYVYENIGTSTNPEFRFKQNNFANLAQYMFRNLKIQFADVNRDSKIDLVFTATSQQSGLTGLYYIANKNLSGYNFDGTPVIQIPFTVGGTENLHVVDVNGDGQVDVLKGKSNGALEFWRNSGSLVMELEDEAFLGIGADVTRANQSVRTGDLNADGKPDLILGDPSGKLRIYNDYINASDGVAPVTDLVYNSLLNSYYAANLGGRVWPTVVNLFGEPYPQIAVGTTLGGLRILRNTAEPAEDDVRVHVFPNPQQKGAGVKIFVSHPATVEVYSIKGQPMPLEMSLIPRQETFVPLGELAAGVYILRFKIEGKYYTRKLVVY